jgi:hypothetical protein
MAREGVLEGNVKNWRTVELENWRIRELRK